MQIIKLAQQWTPQPGDLIAMTWNRRIVFCILGQHQGQWTYSPISDDLGSQRMLEYYRTGGRFSYEATKDSQLKPSPTNAIKIVWKNGQPVYRGQIQIPADLVAQWGQATTQERETIFNRHQAFLESLRKPFSLF